MSKSKPSPIAAAPKGKKLIPFVWYEGRFSHSDWLLPLLPERRHDCELAFSAEGIIYRFDLKIPAFAPLLDPENSSMISMNWKLA